MYQIKKKSFYTRKIPAQKLCHQQVEYIKSGEILQAIKNGQAESPCTFRNSGMNALN